MEKSDYSKKIEQLKKPKTLKKIKRFLKQRFIPCFVVAVIFGMSSAGFVYPQEREITVIDGPLVRTAQVEDQTVSELLESLSIDYGENDRANVKLWENCQEVTEVIIDRAYHAYVVADGEVEAYYTQGDTVAEFLEEQNIELGELDVVEPSLDAPVYNGLAVRITRYMAEEEIVTEEIPFESESRENSSLLRGKTKISVEGENGIREYVYKITYKDGEQISRELVEVRVAKEPVTEITDVGTKEPPKELNLKTASVSSMLDYTKVYDVVATAYDPTAGPVTALGKKVQVGIIAVDPKVIPLGTKLYVESADNGKSWVYGYCVAGDVGGAIKNMRIDLFFNTPEEAVKFGVRKAKVYVLE